MSNKKRILKKNSLKTEEIVFNGNQKEELNIKNEIIEEIVEETEEIVNFNEEIRLKSLNLREPETFEEAFNYLKEFNNLIKDFDNFKYFMNLKWNSTREKQETYFRLFAYLGLINNFKEYKVSVGNFNKGEIILVNNIINFYKNKKIKDTDDKSDLTLYRMNEETGDGDLILTTSKNLKDYTIEKLETFTLETIYHESKKQNKFSDELNINNFRICIVIPNKEVLIEKIKGCRINIKNKKIIENFNENIVIDWSDLYKNYLTFNNLFKDKSYDELYVIEKKILIPKFHQDLTLKKTIKLIDNMVKEIIWGQICRSGKSFMMFKLVIVYSKYYRNDDEEENYLIITLAPSETIHQYLDILENYIEFDDFEIIVDGVIKTDKKKKIYIYSKQKITNKNNIQEFKQFFAKTSFEITFVDEAHYGGVTDISKDVYKKIKTNHIIFMTATYGKPMIHFDIPLSNCVFFDLYDYELLKNIRGSSKILINNIENNVLNKEILAERYDLTKEEFNQLISVYDEIKIEKEYKINPDLHVLTWQMNEETINQIEQLKVKDQYAGFSLDSLFLLNKKNVKDEESGKMVMKFIPSFQNPAMVQKLLRFLFGKKDYEYEDEFDKMSFMERIKNIRMKNEESSGIEHKEIILCFLPMGFGSNINCLSEAFKEKYNEDRENLIDYSILIINNEKNDGKDAKRLILEAHSNLESSKKGLIVLTGKQCHLGVTLEDCDTVILLNNLENIDTIYQMAFRSMSHRENKRSAFLIDLDIQRMIQFIVNFSTKTFKNYSIKNAIKKLLKSHIIRFNSDVWSEYFEMIGSRETEENLDTLSKRIFNTWSNDQKSCLKSLLNNFSYDNLLKNEADQRFIDNLFDLNEKKKNTKKNIEELSGKNTELSRGIEIKKYTMDDEDESKSESYNSDEEEKSDYIPKVNFVKDILKNIIPIMCLLTISDDNNDSFIKMYNKIKDGYSTKYKNSYIGLIMNDINSINSILINELNEMKLKLNKTKVESKKNLLKNIIQKIELGIQQNIELLNEEFNPENIEYLNNNISQWKELKDIWKNIHLYNENNIQMNLFEYVLNKYIGNNNSLEYIFDEQVKICWGKKIKMTQNILDKIKDIFIKNLGDNEEINILIKRIKEIFKNTIYNYHQLSELIDDYLKPTDNESEENAEVSTPKCLRTDMLNKIPNEFWTNPNNKIFEPCSGKGGFLIDIVDKFMTGLKDQIRNDEMRYKHIVENCIYFSEKSSLNIYINKLLLDPYQKYQLNFNEGDTLELNIYTKWNIDGFNAIIGNPPFNKSNSIGTGNTIWQEFVKKAINNWLLNNGYLIYVHPPGWRKPESDKSKNKGLFKLMTSDNTMIYLEMHDTKDGLKTFKKGTKYDWYLLKKNQTDFETEIIDEKKIKQNINLKFLPWLSNYDINLSISLLSKDNDKCLIIYDRTNYDVEKNYISKNMDNTYKYPVIHSTSTTSKNKIYYSSRNDKGHYGIKKVIFGDSSIGEPVKDKNGIYAMSEHAMAIQVQNDEELNELYNVLKSDKFKNFIKSCTWSNFQIDYRLFTYLKFDFWKDFI